MIAAFSTSSASRPWRMATTACSNSATRVIGCGRWLAYVASMAAPDAALASASPIGWGREKVGWAVNTAANRRRSVAARNAASGTGLSAGSGRTSRSATSSSARRDAASSTPPT